MRWSPHDVSTRSVRLRGNLRGGYPTAIKAMTPARCPPVPATIPNVPGSSPFQAVNGCSPLRPLRKLVVAVAAVDNVQQTVGRA